jgi:hypothetical protein
MRYFIVGLPSFMLPRQALYLWHTKFAVGAAGADTSPAPDRFDAVKEFAWLSR